MSKWIECTPESVPANIRFDTPPRNQGQIIEVSYGGHQSVRTEYDHTDGAYKRVRDGSDGSVSYYRRAK